MFTKSEQFYDAIYSWKDYKRESARLSQLIEAHKRSRGNTLLDVACGTGGHIPYLRETYQIEGIDLDPGMLAVARARHPDVAFHEGDMLDFDLGRSFDVVICLFGSIAYLKTASRLNQAVASMARHLRPGGVLAVEAFISPATWNPERRPSAIFVDQPNLKIARMMVWDVDGAVAKSDFHYLVGTPTGIEHFTERHEMALFTDEEHRASLAAAGLTVVHDPEGLMGRALWLGVRPE